jgi:hypothetical protein
VCDAGRGRVPSMLVVLLIKHATRMRLIACGLSGTTVFFEIISLVTQFSEKVTERKISGLIFLYNFYVKHFLF